MQLVGLVAAGVLALPSGVSIGPGGAGIFFSGRQAHAQTAEAAASIDRAGQAVNRQLRDAFGMTPDPKKPRRKPAGGTVAARSPGIPLPPRRPALPGDDGATPETAEAPADTEESAASSTAVPSPSESASALSAGQHRLPATAPLPLPFPVTKPGSGRFPPPPPTEAAQIPAPAGPVAMLAGRPVPLPPAKPGSGVADAGNEAQNEAEDQAAPPPAAAAARPSSGFVLFRPHDAGAPVPGAAASEAPAGGGEADSVGPDAAEATGSHPAASARLAFVPLPPPRPGLARQAALSPPAAAPDEESPDDSEEEAEPKAPLPPPAPGSAAPRGSSSPVAASALAKACPSLAASDIAVFAPAPPPTAPVVGCGADKPVLLQGVKATNGRVIAFEPAALLRCDMADAVAHWVREDVEPLVGQLGSPLDTLFVADSYNCRSRNRVAGAKISEHGKGNAMDTHGYRMENGRQVTIGGKGENAMPLDFQNALKASACGRFTTILGPGSDGYHEYHLHVDLAQRRSGGTYCHWAVRAATP